MVKSECIPNSVADARTPQRLLDFDILSCIMSHISAREDLLSCMRTSSSLYTAGIPLLLSFPCLILPQRLRSFHEFLVSRAPASFLNLRDVFFVLYRHDITSTDIELFKDILRKASALEKLRLFGDVLGEDGEARDIVVSLNTLKTLRIYHDSDDEKDLILSRLQAPLEDVRVDFSQKRDVFSLLADFRNTLETINITGARFSGTDLCYRNVTSLEISYYDELRLSVLVPALPNLQKLDVAFSEMTMEDPEMEALREDNLQFQQARVSPMWNLTFLSADANSLYALALQIKVPRVRVVELMPLGMEGDGDPAWWNSTMAVLRPTQLILMGDFPIVDCDQDLSERFCEGMEELRQLHVTLTR
ncbi:hypothetical protein NM688_g7405 [Phlebia brevispora]|uniref:Uncharacterized protein n=1 Tax=Phlebia brevispora TaxID=194682 RepID=A0ACC1S5G9_9APHY|nr:hypothetical protein NM688_g7405 [Phlebia brevispora]